MCTWSLERGSQIWQQPSCCVPTPSCARTCILGHRAWCDDCQRFERRGPDQTAAAQTEIKAASNAWLLTIALALHVACSQFAHTGALLHKIAFHCQEVLGAQLSLHTHAVLHLHQAGCASGLAQISEPGCPGGRCRPQLSGVGSPTPRFHSPLAQFSRGL